MLDIQRARRLDLQRASEERSVVHPTSESQRPLAQGYQSTLRLVTLFYTPRKGGVADLDRMGLVYLAERTRLA